jgi:uncharacterized membrane protein
MPDIFWTILNIAIFVLTFLAVFSFLYHIIKIADNLKKINESLQEQNKIMQAQKSDKS